MAYSYITDSTATQVYGPARRVVITVNKTDAQSVKVIDNDTGTTANVATIAALTVGNRHEYWDFKVGVRIVASGACDITVNATDDYGTH